MKTKHVVLIIDDEASVLRLVKHAIDIAFGMDGIEARAVQVVPEGSENLCGLPVTHRLNGVVPSLILIDWHLSREDPIKDTLPLIREMDEMFPISPIYVISGDTCPEDRRMARTAGARDWYVKSVDTDLSRVIKAGIDEHEWLKADDNHPDWETTKRTMIRRSWQRHDGNVYSVARDTGISESILYSFLQNGDLAS